MRRASPCTGDVIEICDDDYAVSHRGRVLAVNSQTRTLTLDREITLPSPDHADKPG
ncbi:host specificity J domain protein [Escherichia coli p0305293.7]|nr:host specificity J domain protein [Escherichia coli p0305293.12]ENH56810.1 host specificity J domain protein [Escherichia coli p0305293.7]